MKQHDVGELVGLPGPRYRRADVEALVGADHDQMVRWWRAMGFAEIPEDQVAFTDADVEMARRLVALTRSGLVDDDAVLRMARLLGASFSRIAEAQAAQLDELFTAGEELPVDVFADSMMYVWRRHLGAALGRWIDDEEDQREQAVGFADISGFSKMTKQMDPDVLGRLVDDFETTAFDVVSARSGRVVKLIGDEVMFVADTVGAAVDIGLDLMEALSEPPDGIALHCGIAVGPTVTVGGDVFGATVNLASRLTDVARKGRVVLPREAAAALADRDDLTVHRVRRVFDLKGFGRTRLVTVTRNPGDEAAGDDAHSAGAPDPD